MLKCQATSTRAVWVGRRWIGSAACLMLLLVLSGCAGHAVRHTSFSRPFVLGQDNFVYRNDLVWLYYVDPGTGEWTHRPREPKPDYTHHCFVVARAARQFFQHARFDPSQPVADTATYRQLVHEVATTSPRRLLPPEKVIVIPGYTNLLQFSQAHERLLKDECGSFWQSYFQRGHWRMIFPFSSGHQQRTADELLDALRRNRPPVLHLVRFPSLSINHAVLVIGSEETEEKIRFAVYDPYEPTNPVNLEFDRKQQRFSFPRNAYFIGGRVDVYEVYCSWKY